jgi:tRNA 2-thiouridine synthesizing protein B
VILHTLNKAQSHQELNQQLTNVCSNNDSVLLIEDGVYQLLTLPGLSDKHHWSLNAHKIYVLTNDASARGIHDTNIDAELCNIRFISYAEFVELSATHTKTISWY